jgi:hypothetical protein
MRKMLDKLISWTGLVMAAVLLVAGGLLTWASNFVAENVRTQLADQHITMPDGPAIEDPLIKPYLTQFAGQPMENGEQARAYADHYILVHMNKSSNRKTYAEVSSEYNKLKATAGAEVPPKSWRVPYAASVWRAVVVSKVTGAIIAAEL